MRLLTSAGNPISTNDTSCTLTTTPRVFKNVTLSSDIEYKIVVPYDVAIKKFREEANDVITI